MDEFTDIFRRYIRPMAPLPTDVEPSLDRLRPFSAIFFDVYGTLLISGAGEIGIHHHDGHHQAELSALLDHHGIEQSPESLIQALTQSIRSAHATARRQGIEFPEVDILRIWGSVLEINDVATIRSLALAWELIVNPVYPMPGAAELLSAAARARVASGIISNAQFYTPLILQWVFAASRPEIGFDASCCFFSFREGQAKPSDIMFAKARRAIAKMGVPAHAALYVGNDMRNDVLPARSMGFATALFAGDRRSLRWRDDDDRVGDLMPDLIVTDLRQLLPAIGNPSPDERVKGRISDGSVKKTGIEDCGS